MYVEEGIQFSFLKFLTQKYHFCLNIFTNNIPGYHGTPTSIWCITAASFVFSAVFIYIVIGICMHRKISFSIINRKLYKSLVILCILMTFSWVLGCISVFIANVFEFSANLTFFIPLYMGITINVACGSNFFVLTRYSEEYRNAAREFYGALKIQAAPL